MKKYTLTKMFLNEGATSRVQVGQSSTSYDLLTRAEGDDRYRSVDLPEVGDEVLVGRNLCDFIKTSPVKEICICSDDLVAFRTGTSYYHLEIEEVEDDDEDE